MDKSENAAVDAATKLFQVDDATDDSAVASQEAADAAAEQETEENEDDPFPSWEIELPDDLRDDLELPEAEDDDVVAELEGTEEYQLLDEEGRKLLARARAAEKKAEHYENLRLREAKRGWKEEALKFFPLAAHALDQIANDAKSHRDFRRKAQAAHEAVVPYVKEVTDKAKAVIESEKEKARTEARADAEHAWGRPAKGGGTPVEASITQEQVARNRERGDLASTVKAMIFPKKGEE